MFSNFGKLILWSLIFGSLTVIITTPVVHNKLRSSTAPAQPQTTLSDKPVWVRVDKAEYENSDCNNFCQSLGKTCAISGCDPDPRCGNKALGGMLEIETWNYEVGPICDRTWDGQCSAVIDRYPPSYNFACCCR